LTQHHLETIGDNHTEVQWILGTDCIGSCKSTTIQSPINPRKQIISIQRFGCTYDYPDSSVSTGSESSDARYGVSEMTGWKMKNYISLQTQAFETRFAAIL
jgi:hypothetical protein